MPQVLLKKAAQRGLCKEHSLLSNKIPCGVRTQGTTTSPQFVVRTLAQDMFQIAHTGNRLTPIKNKDSARGRITAQQPEPDDAHSDVMSTVKVIDFSHVFSRSNFKLTHFI